MTDISFFDAASAFMPRDIWNRFAQSIGQGATVAFRRAKPRQEYPESPTTVFYQPSLVDPGLVDLSVFPGEAASPQARARAQERLTLIGLVRKFAAAVGADDVAEAQISHETWVTAEAFFRLLPAVMKTPKVAPDGEGSLLVIWDEGTTSTLVVIDGSRIHMAAEATTPEAVYYEDLFFDGTQIPRVVVEAILPR